MFQLYGESCKLGYLPEFPILSALTYQQTQG
jgi:hypothetical protein